MSGPWEAYQVAPQQDQPPEPTGPWSAYQSGEQRPVDAGLLARAAQMARQYTTDVLTGVYARQGLENLTGAYKWNPDISQLENMRAAARDPASIAQATNIALALTPAPIAAVRPPVPPTAVATKAAGGQGFNDARKLGVEFRGDAVADWGRATQLAQDAKGRISERAPETHALLNRLVNPPTPEPGAPPPIVTTDAFHAIRQALSEVKQSGSPTDRLAAGDAVRSIDKFLEARDPSITVPGTATPDKLGALADTWAKARGNWAAAQRSNDITGALDRANTGITDRAAARAAAANSGTNIDNALRQRVASFLQQPRNISGYSDAEIAALQNFVRGDRTQEALRTAANFFGGGRGLLGALWSMGGGGAGAAVGGPMGGAIGAASPIALSSALKAAQNSRALRKINAIDEMIRSRSPLYEAMMQQPPPLPGIDKQALLLRLLAMGGQSAPQIAAPLGLPGGQPNRQ